MNAISSIRIVSVDHYMTVPRSGLDHCYSKFHGKTIKQVPVIRIFGSDEDGQKICLHVHGVLPYIYIPYDQSISRTEQFRLIYQMIASLEKAINIMLGQGSSDVHHVFDVVHVKGIPFYGYHPKEHQYLKIQFYNPYLTKKAAALFQNAAICGKLFQAHEAHIPYILQFFMDYNLYGMSHVHIRAENIIMRGNTESNHGLTKQSRCSLEGDTLGVHIMNFLRYGQQEQRHQNPGIAFIWQDEIARRKALDGPMVPVELPESQERRNVYATESDLFHRSALIAKLESPTEVSTETQPEPKNMQFSLTRLLINSVYPAEFDGTADNILNASCLPSLSQNSEISRSHEPASFLDVTVVDEDIVHGLSQQAHNEKLDDEDLEMLKIFEELENKNDPIDDNSLLAPLSQVHSSRDLNKSQRMNLSQLQPILEAEDASEESDQDSLNGFNMTLLDDGVDAIPQMDGLDDNNYRSCVKREINFEPKTPKKSIVRKSRYAPLQLTIRQSPRKALEKEIAQPTTISTGIKQDKELDNVEVNPESKLNLRECSVVLERIPDTTEQPVSVKYDLEKNYVPEAGPSKLEDMHLHISESDSNHPESSEEDLGIQSFYERTFVFSPDSENERSFSLSFNEFTSDEVAPSSGMAPSLGMAPERSESVIIRLELSPPDPESVLHAYHSFGILDHEFDRPFYGNPKDVERRKEIGNVLLDIKAKNDCEPFQNLLKTNDGDIPNRIVYACPFIGPPSVKDAKVWLKARDSVNMVEKPVVTEDSPVKMKREKVLMIMENEGREDLEKPLIKFVDDPNLSLSSGQTIDLNASGSVIDASPHQSLSVSLKRKRGNRRYSRKLNASKKLNLSNTIPEHSELFQSQGKDCLSTMSPADILKLQKDKEYLNLTATSFEKDESQFSQPTLNNTYGFKMDLENLNDVKVDSQYNHLVIFSLEIHVQSRDNLLPDPDEDSVAAVFYAVHNDSKPSAERPKNVHGVIIVSTDHKSTAQLACGINVNAIGVATELKLFEKLLEIIYFWDPDILAGYEIEMSSWGFLIHRCQNLNINFPSLLSRVILKRYEEVREEEDVEREYDTQLKIHGRIVIDLWRLMRHEINLTSYSFENIMYHVLHRRYPKHSHHSLSKWWSDPKFRWMVLEYYIQRSCGNLEIMEQLDLIGRTCELAKLFGIQFYEVLSRGSQFRVESMMLRMAKPRNFVAISPSVKQRAHMRAPEYLPLILEPESRLYVDPVIVLDFQSLYPSMIIAYNYCFSTCLGRVEHLGDANPFEFGANQLCVSPKVLKDLIKNDLITVAPCGVAFVKSQVRQGTLPRLLKEILDTRIMVKNSMKLHKQNKLLQRVLHSRQLGLKLIANVTYGYTAANFSGRMSCVEVADSILSKARETLERAIKLVEENHKWNVKVVYGDTDSMFVHVPGRSREQAFEIGEEIVKLVTEDNPSPVKLKLEKVYQPCILQTKKRYVGFMYETKDQAEPVYEAKGIETVRRDGCPVVAKMLEKVLRLLFETKDVSRVKQYVCRQFTKIIEGKINIQDLIFAKEFRGIDGYKPNACVPALELTRKWKKLDRRKEPRHGERVPYVIVNGSPGLPLIKLVRCPQELLADVGLKTNSFYYILKAIIPPLNRCLLLIGANVNSWFDELRRTNLIKQEEILLNNNVIQNQNDKKKSTISQYFASTNCIIDCGRQTTKVICDTCRSNPQKVASVVSSRMQMIERKYWQVEQICQSCCGRSYETDCMSLDCPIIYVRKKQWRKHQQLNFLYECLDDI